jgi:hypothetical protein
MLMVINRELNIKGSFRVSSAFSGADAASHLIRSMARGLSEWPSTWSQEE